MGFDFDTIIERKGTNCLKYDFAAERGKPADVLPFWVADMDFQTAPIIRERLAQAVEHGIFGYSEGKDDYFQALQGWYETHFDWKIQRNWLIKTPGVVFALAMAVRAFSEKGDGVLIQQPVYYPFQEVIVDNGRTLVNSPLKQVDGRYEMDFEDLEQKIAENNVKVFLLCSPHNPVGRVWKKWELKKLGEICKKYNVIVVSDEIHSDFVWEGHKHTVFASLSPEIAEITITCTAPSKTFNVAGLQLSNILIPNQKLRRKFRHEVTSAGYSQVNVMGLVACQAAYEGGEEWLLELKKYLWDNYLFLKDYIEEKMPKLHVGVLEGTYLVWIDFRELGLTEEQREDLIVKKAHLWLDSGAIFGEDGEGFERINIACPKSVLKQALDQLYSALETLSV
jgi:cystathionine beta-lyase